MEIDFFPVEIQTLSSTESTKSAGDNTNCTQDKK